MNPLGAVGIYQHQEVYIPKLQFVNEDTSVVLWWDSAGVNGSITPLNKIFVLLRTRMRSSIDDESSVKCVDSDISYVRLNSRVFSVILLCAFFIFKLKSSVIIISIMFVLHALSIN